MASNITINFNVCKDQPHLGLIVYLLINSHEASPYTWESHPQFWILPFLQADTSNDLKALTQYFQLYHTDMSKSPKHSPKQPLHDLKPGDSLVS